MPKSQFVSVHPLPARVTTAGERTFLRELRPFVAGERPRLVLDCSAIEQVDDAVVSLLLQCLEEAMKGNGDAKIAGVTQAGEAALRRAQIHRLFEIYPTPDAAVRSYTSHLGDDTAAASPILEKLARAGSAA